MITTIQIHEEVKSQLDKLKDTGKESYEEVIVNMIEQIEKQRRAESALLIEGYKEMAQESLKTTKEWSAAEPKWE